MEEHENSVRREFFVLANNAQVIQIPEHRLALVVFDHIALKIHHGELS